MTATNDTEVNFVLHHDNTTNGDVWFCNGSVYDGVHYSDWINSSEVAIESVANKTDFTDTVLQSNNVKDVFVYDASRESWNREDSTADWFTQSPVDNKNFPDKTYLFLTDSGLDIIASNDTDSSWMKFNTDSNDAIEANDFTSVYALDGKIYVGSDTGLYVLDFVSDSIYKYNSSGVYYYNNGVDPFQKRNLGQGYTTPGESTGSGILLRSNVVNDVHANRVRGRHLVAVATDGIDTGILEGAVTIFNMNNGDVAELDFCNDTSDSYSSGSVFIADDGTLYFSENNLNSIAGETKLSYRYDVDDYNLTTERGEGAKMTGQGQNKVLNCEAVGYRSNSSVRGGAYPHFLSERINDIYVTFETSTRHLSHNTIYVATEKGISVIQEDQPDPGNGDSKIFGYSASLEPVDYKVLVGLTDNVTAITARSDGNAIYVGTDDGGNGGSVSKISLSSNALKDSWNTTTDTAIVADNITCLDFLDGDLLVGTVAGGATQIVEDELDHYLVTDYENHRVVEIDNTGLIHWEFGVYGVPGDNSTYLTNPTYAVRHDDGNYLIADSGNRRILEVDSDGDIIQQITNSTQLSDATSFGKIYSIQKIAGT